MTTVVVDTNILLQCKPFEDLDWLSISPGGVHVVIPDTVLDELDHLKYDASRRRAGRARAWLSKASEALDSGESIWNIQHRQGCTWGLGNGDLREHSALDLSKADHKIIAEALKLCEQDPELIFLTLDFQPRRKAQGLGLDARKAPDSWLLDPEPDPKDKQIAELRRQLEATRPKIEVIVNAVGALVERFDAQYQSYNDPSEALLDELMAVVGNRYPSKVEQRENTQFDSWELQIRRYQQEFYPQWLEKVRECLKATPERWSRRDRFCEVEIQIVNAGSVPADRVNVEVSLSGGAMFFHGDADDWDMVTSQPTIPPPPEPVTLYRPSIPRLVPCHIPGPPIARNPQEFYFRNTNPGFVRTLKYECEEFRHGRPEVTLRVNVLMPRSGRKGVELICEVSARNMPKAVKVNVPLLYRATEVDPTDRLRALVDGLKFT